MENIFLAVHRSIHQSFGVTLLLTGHVVKKHCHLLDTTWSILLSSCVPDALWGEVLFVASYLLNPMPTLIFSSSSPYEHPYGEFPMHSLLRVFVPTSFLSLSGTALSLLPAASYVKWVVVCVQHLRNQVGVNRCIIGVPIVQM